MKIVIAPDSFKGSLRSPEVCQAIAAGIRQVMPDAEIIQIPMADGGEGTVEAAVLSTGGQFEDITVTGPLGAPVKACYGLPGGKSCAIMEMAAASGIELIPANQLDPLKATTYGTGEIIRAIIGKGIREIIIGIGGSATVDGGVGMAQALGFRFFDVEDRELPPGIGGGDLCHIRRIDCSMVEPMLRNAGLRLPATLPIRCLAIKARPEFSGRRKARLRQSWSNWR